MNFELIAHNFQETLLGFKSIANVRTVFRKHLKANLKYFDLQGQYFIHLSWNVWTQKSQR